MFMLTCYDAVGNCENEYYPSRSILINSEKPKGKNELRFPAHEGMFGSLSVALS